MSRIHVTHQPLLHLASAGTLWASLLAGILGCDGDSAVPTVPETVADQARFPEASILRRLIPRFENF